MSSVANPWQALRALTQARIALGRAGVSMPSEAQLAFQLAHAQARDAVHRPLDAEALAERLGRACLLAHSACPDRATYLQRPDLGRSLDQASALLLSSAAPAACDLALVVADGLSALAIERNVQGFLEVLLPRLEADGWALAPLVIARQARVAIGDQAGALLNARAGLTDADRNCISNVRPAGQGYAQAAHTLHYLLDQARSRGISGVALKDETGGREAPLSNGTGNFLLK